MGKLIKKNVLKTREKNKLYYVKGKDLYEANMKRGKKRRK